MTYDTVYRIEKLGKRIAWMINHLEHNHLCLGDPNNPVPQPTTISEVYRTLRSLRPGKIVKEATWQKYLNGRTPASLAVIKGLMELYPSMPLELLVTSDFSDFERETFNITEARSRWKEATEHVAVNRDELAKLAKKYYRPVDDSRDERPVVDGPLFPLITQPGWLLEEPILLSENDPVPEFENHIEDKQSFSLEGWPGPYWLIKKSMMTPLGLSKLTNGLTYRLSEVKADGKQIELRYSPGNYFN